ncbi:hypothetical protein SRHO_G00099300 [Serrasalmus rhombeus]
MHVNCERGNRARRKEQETLHQTEKEGNTVALRCGNLTKGKVKWSRDANGQRVDILTTHNGEMTKHITDPDKRYNSQADLALIIRRVSQSDAGRYDCSGAAVELSVTSGTGYAVKHNQEHVYDSIDDTMPTAQPVSDQQRTEEPIYYLATDPGAQTTDNQQSAYEAIDPPEEHATPQERVDQLCGLIKKPTK